MAVHQFTYLQGKIWNPVLQNPLEVTAAHNNIVHRSPLRRLYCPVPHQWSNQIVSLLPRQWPGKFLLLWSHSAFSLLPHSESKPFFSVFGTDIDDFLWVLGMLPGVSLAQEMEHCCLDMKVGGLIHHLCV